MPAATLFGPDRVIPPTEPPLAAASFIPIAHSISIPTAPSTPHTASISTRSVVVPGPKARGLAAPRAVAAPWTLRGQCRHPPAPSSASPFLALDCPFLMWVSRDQWEEGTVGDGGGGGGPTLSNDKIQFRPPRPQTHPAPGHASQHFRQLCLSRK